MRVNECAGFWDALGDWAEMHGPGLEERVLHRLCTVTVSGFAEALLDASVSSTADSISALILASHPQNAQASRADPPP